MMKNIIHKKTDILGPREHEFLTSMAGKGKRIFRIEDAVAYWRSNHLARKALSRLESKGWLKRIERGLYLLVPLEAGPEGLWSEDAMVIAAQLAPQGTIAYWTALHYWGMTDQVSQTVFIQTAHRRNRNRVTILGVRYHFIVVIDRKMFGEVTQTSDGMPFRVTDREKTLVDAFDRPDLCGGIRQVAEALKSDEPLDWQKMDDYLNLLGSGAVYKRLGYLVEMLDIPVPDRPARLKRWRNALTQGIALLEPRADRIGPIDTSWRTRINVKALERST
jgi:predicted transcriptional regulator of viral defense system